MPKQQGVSNREKPENTNAKRRTLNTFNVQLLYEQKAQ